MSNLKPSPSAVKLNEEETIHGRRIKWSEKGRILVYCKQGRKIVEVYDYSATALKGVRDNLTASNGETTASTHIGGKGWVFYFNSSYARIHEKPTFSFAEGKFDHEGNDYEILETARKTANDHFYAYCSELPEFLEQDATYRVHPDGSLEKVRSRTFENRNRFDFPVFTVVPVQSKRAK
ncbi:hypothetical protein Ab1vBOLIVR5_gp33c [Agrobacterium phage OLIVR5]|uniref:Uncharacterized protein n=2 Tax=Caudoviricetes TaxID=2731619 RepID=A0A858MTF5_9CAUD|nr:hypothetical protein KNU99_gp033 [Agrobacterium phage OLIVR5]QIW87681.1 hypothetical protein Ab1vBOLIVR5_gp33c [Agrobacterium phage OLIVR5]QIW87943.1 hypothetical protein Ab1vBOLIVR6_gp36c [Agrobacterium phage OLIVR6]